MVPFLAIVKLTCRSAIRSNVFRFLLILLILCVVLVPNTIQGDGTAYGYIQIMLEYSLGIVTLILSTSVIWISCSEMCTDVENSQIHMIVVKPVSRVVVWLGKFSGIMLIHLILLALAAAFIYGFTMFQYKNRKFSEFELAKVQNEVFTGRRVFLPEIPDMTEEVNAEFEKRIKEASSRGEHVPNLSGPERRKQLNEIYKQKIAALGEVLPGQLRMWEFKGLPNFSQPDPKAAATTPPKLMFVRYKAFSGNLYTKDQKLAFGQWGIRLVEEATDKEGKSAEPKSFIVMRDPEQILCGTYNEFPVRADYATYKGTAVIAFANLGEDGKSLHFQVVDSPKLLIPTISFENNYARSVFVVFLGIFALCGIACSAASFLSMPTAIFITIAYLMIGTFSNYLLGSLSAMEGTPLELMDAIGSVAGKIMVAILIPVQDFFVSGRIANGEMLEFSQIGTLVLFNIIIKGLPFFALGMYLYRRREMAMAQRK